MDATIEFIKSFECLETSTFEAAQDKFYADMESVDPDGDVLYALERELGM